MNQIYTGTGSSSAVQDRTILKNVYLWMTAGLFLTALSARAMLVTGLYRICTWKYLPYVRTDYCRAFSWYSAFPPAYRGCPWEPPLSVSEYMPL